MNEQNSQAEKPKDRHRFSQEQYDMLKRCSEKKDMTEWNQWRKDNPDEDICLQGRDFKGFWLKEVNFISETAWTQADGTEIYFSGEVHLEEARFESACLEQAVFIKAHIERSCFWHATATNAAFHSAHLEDAELGVANFEDCNFSDAILKNASFTPSHLNGTRFTNSNLRGCSMRSCVVDGSTRFWNCNINRYSKNERFTDSEGTPLNNLIIGPSTKQLLEYNIRRMNWEDWYKEHSLLEWLVRPFWWISDYGISTKRIIYTFFGLAFLFAFLYRLFPDFVKVYNVVGDIRSFWHALYFSVVTMTTLGFGDIAANPDSWIGQTLLMIQVILGYVLLGALVTHFAVLFTAGGPAGKFADEKEEKQDKKK